MENNREQRIKARAHELWEAAGRPHGRHDEHWAQAEREIDARNGSVNGSEASTEEVKTAKPKRAPRKAAGKA